MIILLIIIINIIIIVIVLYNVMTPLAIDWESPGETGRPSVLTRQLLFFRHVELSGNAALV